MRERRGEAPALGVTERSVAMRNFPGAGGLGAASLAILASVARLRALRPGEPLEPSGHTAAAVRVLVSGRLVAVDGRPGPDVHGTLEVLASEVALETPLGGPDGAVVLEVALDDLEDVIDEVPALLVGLAAHVGAHALALGERTERGPRVSLPLVIPARPLDLVERLIVLRRCAALERIEIDALAAIAEIASELRLAPGAAAWGADVGAAALIVIASGELAVRGARTTVRLGAGGLAGEAEVLARAPWATEAVARVPTLALVLPRDPLLDLWEDHPQVGLALLRHVATAILASRRGR